MSKLFFLVAMVGTVVLLIVTSSGDCADGAEEDLVLSYKQRKREFFIFLFLFFKKGYD